MFKFGAQIPRERYKLEAKKSMVIGSSPGLKMLRHELYKFPHAGNVAQRSIVYENLVYLQSQRSRSRRQSVCAKMADNSRMESRSKLKFDVHIFDDKYNLRCHFNVSKLKSNLVVINVNVMRLRPQCTLPRETLLGHR